MNEASVLQDGFDNEITLEQAGDENEATLGQTGDGNKMDVTQFGHQSLTATETGANGVIVFKDAAGSPPVTITQTGDNPAPVIITSGP